MLDGHRPRARAISFEFLVWAPVLLFSIVAHEYAHAEAAYRQGDDTAYMLGRLTLNPLKHIDPFMTVLFPVILWFASNGLFTFGAAKPVPVTPRKYRNFRKGDIIVSLAGIATNLGLFVLAGALFAVVGFLGDALPAPTGTWEIIQRMLVYGMLMNVWLAFFNLLPIPPLDGSHVFKYVLPPGAGLKYLLLHLIREDEVDITDLPIAKIADQFLAVINELGLNQAADYLEMAARLLRIKAQLLLPRRVGDDEWEDPRAELVRRLLEYQQIRELVDWLGQAAARRAEQFGRGFAPEPAAASPAAVPLVIELNDLLAAAERVIALIPEPMLHRVVPRPLDVEGATARIQALLAEREQLEWLDVVGERPAVVDVLSTFIALLELAKRGSLKLRQPGPFEPILIQREPPRPAA